MAAVRKVGSFGGDSFLRGGGGGGAGGVSISPALAPALASTADGPQDEPGPGPSSAMAAKITPAVLFITVVLAVVLLVSGMLHVLRRLFLKSHRGSARAEAVERQLFHHGAGPGLDQEAIDALPAFHYGELSGAGKGEDQKKRQFDCAVCLCEFADDNRLRLLPLCGHAFHVACIDTWLRSSSTCPLCRTALQDRATAGAAVVDGAAVADASVEPDIEDRQKQEQEASKEVAAAGSSVILPVRLGRFKSRAGDGDGEGSTDSRVDARRCYSMGSYQYVLAADDLVVSVHWRPGDGSAAMRAGVAEQQGKKVCAAAGRRDSFSVSKIWQWRGGSRRRLPGAASLPADDRLPWALTRTRSTRQETDT